MELLQAHRLRTPGMSAELAEYYVAFAPWPAELAAAVTAWSGRAPPADKVAALSRAVCAAPAAWAATWTRAAARFPPEATAAARAFYGVDDAVLACAVAGCQLLPRDLLFHLLKALRQHHLPRARTLPRVVRDRMRDRDAQPAAPHEWPALVAAALPR